MRKISNDARNVKKLKKSCSRSFKQKICLFLYYFFTNKRN